MYRNKYLETNIKKEETKDIISLCLHACTIFSKNKIWFISETP